MVLQADTAEFGQYMSSMLLEMAVRLSDLCHHTVNTDILCRSQGTSLIPVWKEGVHFLFSLEADALPVHLHAVFLLIFTSQAR